MKLINFSIIAVTTVFLFSCRTLKKAETKHHNENTHTTHWGYKGENDPAHWSNIKDDYLACSGNSQSPINIEKKLAKKHTGKNNLQLNYMKSILDILNNGHTEEFVISKGNSLVFNNKTYQLKQFHMHTLSEHTVNGDHFPLEIHFVNKAEDGTYAVLSILLKEGKESLFLGKYLAKFPKTKGEYKSNEVIDINSVIPNTEHYYHYKGSFTTPPCTEVVDWIILQDNPTASKKQLTILHNLMHDNYRPIQKLNERVINFQ